MKYIPSLFLFACLTVSAFAQNRNVDVASTGHVEKLSELFRQSAQLAMPAVVKIRVTQHRAVGRSSRTPRTLSEESGSGIVATIAHKQVILTNRHIIGDAERDAVVILTHDRRILTPVKIAANEDFDLAIIEVAEKLPISVSFGNSEQVRTGDIVLAVGNPLELDRSLSMGIISAERRRRVPGASGAVPRVDFFQTDAAINPGSSGGALLNVQGEVIGIITAIATQGGGNEGIAFVMPINAVLRIAEQLVQTGVVEKPHIGCNFDPAFSQLTSSASEERQRWGIERFVGAKILNVVSDTPATQAGLKSGDVILTFGNTEVEDDLHILHLVAQSEIGKPVVLQINRSGEVQNVTITPQAQLSR